MPAAGVTFVLIARVPADGVAAFQAYEANVLPLLARHGGVLERRLRSADQQTELHIVWFPSAEQFEGFRNDPRRAEHAALLHASAATTELLRLDDVV